MFNILICIFFVWFSYNLPLKESYVRQIFACRCTSILVCYSSSLPDHNSLDSNFNLSNETISHALFGLPADNPHSTESRSKRGRQLLIIFNSTGEYFHNKWVITEQYCQSSNERRNTVNLIFFLQLFVPQLQKHNTQKTTQVRIGRPTAYTDRLRSDT